jgi:hypothetical protein
MTVEALEESRDVPVSGYDRARGGPAMQLVQDGVVWALFGLSPYLEGKADAWIYVTEEGHAHGPTLLRTVRRALDAEIDSGRWRRLQVLIPEEFGACHRMANWLGFEVEGMCRAAGPNDENCIIYGMVI